MMSYLVDMGIRNLMIFILTVVDMGGEYAAVIELEKGKGVYRICQLQLNDRINSNPAAKRFAMRVLGDVNYGE